MDRAHVLDYQPEAEAGIRDKPQMTATEIASLLAARAEQVAQHLLPNGVKNGHDWCVGSVSGEAGKSCRVCTEGSKAGVWADFSQQGKKGDLIGLWMETKGVDLSTACTQALEWLGVNDGEDWGEPNPTPKITTENPLAFWEGLQNKMRKGTPAEISALAELRKIPATAGLELASNAGQLWFADVFDDGFEYPSWIITDGSRRNAQARRMDGQPWSKGMKAKTIKGCEAKYPVGLFNAIDKEVVFVEGGPDLLAAWHYIWLKDQQATLTPVTMFGASMVIPQDALPAFGGKTVFTFPHNDEAGTKAMERWSSQMRGAKAAEIIPFDFHPAKVKDLNDLAEVAGMCDDEGVLPDVLLPLFTGSKIATIARTPFSFQIPADNDGSILLGNRYLNRGDGAVISSTSGMGKSSMCLQMATEYALDRAPLGIKGNGPLRSLIIQSEDSDGDVAEVMLSIRHVLQLTDAEVMAVNDRVKIVCDRVNRGDRFLISLKKLIARHKPDLVWINPLQAFIEGDVTDSQDLGKFLREGLNSLNEPAQFAYILVHHTTKPATGKDKATRLWHEVMYDMAGGAEIINWARAIMSLRASEKEGDFNLVLAKRGRRAGVTRMVEQGAGEREEIVTTIPLRHAQGKIEVLGVKRPISLIYWESREPDAEKSAGGVREGAGRKSKYEFDDFKGVLPPKSSDGLPLNELHSKAIQEVPIQKQTLHNVLKRWVELGWIETTKRQGVPTTRYRLAL